ncbi:MAG TPA: hypothetical protein VM925_28640 [Labilithrix sp.]|nr:hypothetical protein [Labilithrix sp.]
MARFPPLRHQPRSARAVRIGFILDGDHSSVAASLREVNGAIHCVATGTTKLDVVRKQVARIFSLDHDATEYPQIAERDSNIAPLMASLPGLRPVCFTSPYESACWAIISQRITKTQAARIVAELVRAHGERVLLEGEPIGVFPRPDRLLDVSSIDGLPTIKVDRLHGIARAAQDGKLDAGYLRSLGAERAPQALRFLPGIGPFWASGIYLRACGITDVFPDEPLAVAALGSLHGLGDSPTASQLAPILDRYRPFRMWIAFLLRVAVARGILEGSRFASAGTDRPQRNRGRSLSVSRDTIE